MILWFIYWILLKENLRCGISMVCLCWQRVFFLLLMYWQRFFCGGRLIFGPDVASLFLSTVLILGPGLLFCLKVHYKIKEDKNDGDEEWYFIMAVGAILTILVSNIFLFAVSTHVYYIPYKKRKWKRREGWKAPLQVNYKKCSPCQMTSMYSIVH